MPPSATTTGPFAAARARPSRLAHLHEAEAIGGASATARRGRRARATRRCSAAPGPRAEQDVLELGRDVAEALERPLAPVVEELDLLPELVDPPPRLGLDFTRHLLGRLAHRPRLLLGLRHARLLGLLLRLAALLRRIGVDRAPDVRGIVVRVAPGSLGLGRQLGDPLLPRPAQLGRGLTPLPRSASARTASAAPSAARGSRRALLPTSARPARARRLRLRASCLGSDKPFPLGAAGANLSDLSTLGNAAHGARRTSLGAVAQDAGDPARDVPARHVGPSAVELGRPEPEVVRWPGSPTPRPSSARRSTAGRTASSRSADRASRGCGSCVSAGFERSAIRSLTDHVLLPLRDS